MSRLLLALTFLVCICPQRGAAQSPVSDAVAKAMRGQGSKPRLVVVLVIDQLRADYLTRFADLFLPGSNDGKPGGFRQLMAEGAWFVDARYEHFPLFTGPGHAVVMTGGHPYKTGIVGNEWWDARSHRLVYCADDPRYKVVGASDDSHAVPMGPLHLLSSTVGDELKLATAGRARVVSLGLKDRASILLGGHATDVCLWFDTTDGRWISSSAYARSGALPGWVEKLNAEHLPDKTLGTSWTCSVAPTVLAERALAPQSLGSDIPPGFGPAFPHAVGAEKTRANYRAFVFTPDANAFTFETAQRAVEAEGLGRDEIPDILAVNLSTNDYVGHAYGPYSPEVLDVTLRTDQQLAGFLGFLNQRVPGGLASTVFVLTADHAVSPVPEDVAAQPLGLTAGRYKSDRVATVISSALTARIGPPAGSNWFSASATDPRKSGAFIDGFVCLSAEATENAIATGKAKSRRDIEQVACDAVNGAGIPGVYGCYGKTQILEGRLPDHDMASHLAKAIHPQVSVDLIVIANPMSLEDPSPEGHATTHGSPYIYDAHVPVILSCPGLIRPGVYADPVSPADIAPTLSLLLGIEFPSGCDGRPLLPALRP